MFRLLPSPDECERIVSGELAMEQVDGPRFPYIYGGFAGNATVLRDASDGTYVEALKADEGVRSRKKTRDTVRDAIEDSPRPGKSLWPSSSSSLSRPISQSFAGFPCSWLMHRSCGCGRNAPCPARAGSSASRCCRTDSASVLSAQTI